MSIEAALARVSQIETALVNPAAAQLAAATSTAATGGVAIAPGGAQTGSGATTTAQPFMAQLQQALAPGTASDTYGGTPSALYAAGTPGSLYGPGTAGGLYGSLGASGLTGIGAVSPGSTAAQAIVQIAEGEVGQSEQPPGSNDSARIATYRTATAGAMAGEPWCAYFASWAANRAGEPLGNQGQGFGYVGDIWNWAQSNGRAIPNGPGVTPTPGDLILFGDHHVGIVEKVLPSGQIQTIEGNYSNQVSRVIRGPGEASGYVRM